MRRLSASGFGSIEADKPHVRPFLENADRVADDYANVFVVMELAHAMWATETSTTASVRKRARAWRIIARQS
jgi:hypothetical protein